jgi:hypothetical protein
MKLLCWLILAFASSASAGALFPCVKAAASKNGSFMVIVDGRTLTVFSKEDFINETQRLDGPATFWTTGWNGWSVILNKDQVYNEPECPLPMITDDGEFMILVSTGPVLGKDAIALQIYRRRDHRGDPVREGPDHGVFVQSIRIDQLWRPDKITTAWDDETPEWFAGGKFDFSPNLRELILTTKWGDTVHVDLPTGGIIRY